MAELKSEYTDIKNVKHSVEHIVIPADDGNSRERIIEELLAALTQADRSFAV